MFKIGDTVKGNEFHINPLRMDDIGVIVELSPKDPIKEGCWVMWEKELTFNSVQFALFSELTLVKSAE